MNLTLTAEVGQIVAEHPRLSRVFEELQIDYCCGGKRALEAACKERGLAAKAVLQRLAEEVEHAPETGADDWNAASLAAICDHIEQTHHRFLRAELPRLTGIIAKVVRAHGGTHAELADVEAVFAELRGELEPHMLKEERVLFPAIRALESRATTAFPFGTLANPIRVMVDDHEHAGEALLRLRQLTNNYAPPDDACNTYRAMIDGLETLERDMHQHVHKENNILFPRAVSLEGAAAEREPPRS